jgi:hypothetical protein
VRKGNRFAAVANVSFSLFNALVAAAKIFDPGRIVAFFAALELTPRAR